MHARAAEASARASESAGAADEAAERAIESGDEEPDPSGPSAELRDLFRQAAKQFHPDLAGDDAERARRTKLMAALNSAYQAGDADAIRRMLAGEAARPEAIKGDDVGSRIVRVFRKLAQIRARFTELVQLHAALDADPLFALFSQVRDQWQAGTDPLAEDEADLRTKSVSAQARLAALVTADAKRPRSAES